MCHFYIFLESVEESLIRSLAIIIALCKKWSRLVLFYYYYLFKYQQLLFPPFIISSYSRGGNLTVNRILSRIVVVVVCTPISLLLLLHIYVPCIHYNLPNALSSSTGWLLAENSQLMRKNGMETRIKQGRGGQNKKAPRRCRRMDPIQMNIITIHSPPLSGPAPYRSSDLLLLVLLFLLLVIREG